MIGLTSARGKGLRSINSLLSIYSSAQQNKGGIVAAAHRPALALLQLLWVTGAGEIGRHGPTTAQQTERKACCMGSVLGSIQPHPSRCWYPSCVAEASRR